MNINLCLDNPSRCVRVLFLCFTSFMICPMDAILCLDSPSRCVQCPHTCNTSLFPRLDSPLICGRSCYSYNIEADLHPECSSWQCAPQQNNGNISHHHPCSPLQNVRTWSTCST